MNSASTQQEIVTQKPPSTEGRVTNTSATVGSGFRLRFCFCYMMIARCAIVAFLSTILSQPVAHAESTIDRILPRMVKIYGAGGIRNLYAYSTGFTVSPDGHIVTIWNHVLDTDHISVVLHDGRRFSAVVVSAEPQLNLALLKLDIEGRRLPYIDLDTAIDVRPGTRAFAFSNMFKVATGDEPVSVMHSSIAARTKLSTRRGAFEVPYDGDLYVLDAATNNSGAGGGLVTNLQGMPVGMIGRELRNSESNTWVNYAIPLTKIGPVVEEMLSGEYKSNIKSGTDKSNPRRYRPRDFGFLMVPDVVQRTPAYVESVLTKSAAAGVGIRPDDLILFVNDDLIQSCRVLNDRLGRLEAGDTVKLILRRGDELVSVELIAKKNKDD
jgi:serine protease Do